MITKMSQGTTVTFSPKEITSQPKKDIPGVPKTVFNHVSNLHNLLENWLRVVDKGTKLCRTVSALKLHLNEDNHYPTSLGPLMEGLLNTMESLKDIIDGIEIINKQLKAMAKLQPGDEPVINTWSSSRISNEVDRILKCLKQEFELKKIVTENLAHCRDEATIEVYVSSYEFEPYFDIETTSFLFIDVGLTAVT